MKAALFKKYGSPQDVLHFEEMDKPLPKENEVLVKVKCSAINDWDWNMIRGKPFLLRLMFGFINPKHQVPGMEFSGIIEDPGKDPSVFKTGDEVFGDSSDYGFGTFAEYVCVNKNSIVKKPSNMSFEEAAAVSHASMLAYQSIIDLGRIENGQRILINGAGGGFGTAAFQILKQYDVHITGVDSGVKLQMMDKIGFDQIIDYKKEDFTKSGIKYDFILDAKSTRNIFSYSKSLNKNGQYISVGGHLNRILEIVLLNPIFSLFSKKRFKILSLKPNKDLDEILRLYEMRKIKFILDGPYPFSEIMDRVQYFGEAKHSGKVIITIS